MCENMYFYFNALKKKKKLLPIHLFLGLNMFLVCKFWGQNGLILLFGKIYCNLPLFLKYINIYHYLKTRVPQTRVCYKTRVLLKFVTVAMAELKFFIFKMPPSTQACGARVLC